MSLKNLVNLLHGRGGGGLQWGRGVVVSLDGRGLVLVDRETERDHLREWNRVRFTSFSRQGRETNRVDARGEVDGRVKSETGGEERGLVEEDGEVADGLVGSVLGDLAPELLDDRVVGVDFERL